MDKKAIILGAGPTGLVLAWKLLENGWQVDLYEKNQRVGGMCQTWPWGEFLVDVGPHIFHTPESTLAEFWEKEFGDLFVKGEFRCKNVQGEQFDQLYDYPISWEGIAHFPAEIKKQIITELEQRNPEEKKRATTYREYMNAEVGPTLREMFFERYPQKIWGIPTDRMSAIWAPKRIEFRQKITPFYHQQWNAVGKYGTGCIFERILEKIVQLGGRCHLQHSVQAIAHQENRLQAIQFANGQRLEIDAEDVVVSTLPITLTAQLLGEPSALRFRGICSLFFAYNSPSILPEGCHWLYYDSPKVLYNRITEAKKMAPAMAPADKTYLTAEICYGDEDPLLEMPPQQLLDLVAEQIEMTGLASRSLLFDQAIHWEPHVYPLQEVGFQEELARTRAAISKIRGLFSIGAGGDFFYADAQVLFHKAFDLADTLCKKGSSLTQVLRKPPRVTLNKAVTLGQTTIGDEQRAYIIAEAGLNHNGSLAIAKQLVEQAKAAGCDAVKFQTYTPHSRISGKVKTSRYAEQIIGLEESAYEMFARLSMPFSEQKELFAYARQLGIEIFSTPFDFASVDFLESLGVSLYKIASMDLVNLPLIEAVAGTGKPMILSTGMSTLAQIEEAVETVANAGNSNLMLLHCNSAYPSAPGEMNLRVIQTLKQSFQIPVGLSDHTFGLFTAHTAIVLGANLIERHFTLDRMLEGPDHILSSEPWEMKELVKISHLVPAILGSPVKRIQPTEYDTINAQRKSLYAACDIQAGEVLRREMVTIKGPGGGLLPRYLEVIVGRTVRQNIEADYPITWNDI
ncbi:N-acetylneuraminate synthase family protein [Candidatus Magnetaquicoccus inordinatus]|uniref:N-acetylneuraminate synthase family protein n=1 Tax=Candidatus Magnetaquicoccus inordinatus TaxID=2496818 RepID=UPI00102CD354|nr:N-acetylneuraminate synthase family protein [Candidatus Magnetaquicoccus inordinatus]